jgi:hypothetical protein
MILSNANKNSTHAAQYGVKAVFQNAGLQSSKLFVNSAFSKHLYLVLRSH